MAAPAGRAGPGRPQHRHRGPPGDPGRHDPGPLPGHRPGRGDRPAWHAAHPALVAPAVRLPLLPPLPGRQRRPVDARLAHPLGLRLHRLPGPARRHLPGLRAPAPAHPHRTAPRARPLRPHRPAAAALAPAARRHRRLHQRPRRHASRRAARRRARAGRPAARRRHHRRAALLTRPARGISRPAAVPGRRLRGRPRRRLSRQRDSRVPGRCHRGHGRTRRANRTRRCREPARQPLRRPPPAARARHRVRRHHRRRHAARPARRPRPRHRRLARRQHRQPPQHHQPGRRPHPLGPGQPRPASRPGQAAGDPAGHLLPAPLPRRRRPGPHPRPRPRPGARRSPAVADVARLGTAPDAARGLSTSCATGPRSRSCSPSR